MKRLPTKQSFHPSLQQIGVLVEQSQYFCIMRYPIPAIDQSVMRQVGRDGWNNLTPSLISSIILSFDSSNMSSSVARTALSDSGSSWDVQSHPVTGQESLIFEVILWLAANVDSKFNVS